jgi:hypothetical protein
MLSSSTRRARCRPESATTVLDGLMWARLSRWAALTEPIFGTAALARRSSLAATSGSASSTLSRSRRKDESPFVGLLQVEAV